MGSIPRMNKKGVAEDILFIIVGIFMAAIFLLAFVNLMTDIKPHLQDVGDTTEINKTVESTDVLIGMSDSAFIGVTIGMFIVLIVLAIMIVASPIFFVIYLITATIAVIISAPLSNAYETARTSTILTGAATHLPITNLFMANLPLIMLMFVVVVGIIAYAKFGGGGAGR